MQNNVSTLATTSKKTATDAGGAINIKPLRDALSELETAAQRLQDYRAAYTDVVRAVAEKTGLAAPVIRQFIAARMAESDKTRARKIERAQQLAMVFDEISP
jgi:hypothetical protein